MKLKKLYLSDYNIMVNSFKGESDRGAAVLAGSYVENVIGELLLFKMKDKTLSDNLFGSNGALSSFSQRINIAQAFGIISNNTGETLNHIRKIRNYFAHHPLEATFEVSPIKDWIDKLREILCLRTDQEEIRSDMSHRDVYLISCGLFAASAHVTIEKTLKIISKKISD